MKIVTKLLTHIMVLLMLSSCHIANNNSTSEMNNSISNSLSEQNSVTDSSSIDSSTSAALTQTDHLMAMILDYFPRDVIADLDLFTTHIDYPDFSIVWESSHEQIINNYGLYTRPAEDTLVTLTFRIFFDRKMVASDIIEVCAKGAYTSLAFLNEWFQNYNFDIPNLLTFPITILQTVIGYSELTINWSSSNIDCLKIENNYLMPKSSDIEQNVTLKGEVKVEGVTFTRTFNIVIPKSDDLLPEYGDKYHGLPIMDITTDNNKMPTSLTDYLDGTFKMSPSQAYSESFLVPLVPMKIRVRGNVTAGPEKKPYRIKFEEKQSLFGMGACKNWVLLADYFDETYLREAAPKMLANQLDGMAFNSRYFHVEVYINGQYRGLYLLTDQIQIQNSRVNIHEDDTEVDTGYLMEFDFKTKEEDIQGINYFTVNEIGKVFQMIGPEALSSAQSQFLLKFLNDTAKLIKQNKTSVAEYRDVFDINAAIDYIIVNEIFKNQDVWGLSSYMYKDKGGPLTFGPVWDFHLSAGNCGGYDNPGIPNAWHTVQKDQNQWFYFLMQNDEFRLLFKERWNAIINVQIKQLMEWIRSRQELINEAALASNVRWGTKRSNLTDEVISLNLQTYDEFVDYFYDWVNASIYFMDAEINTASFNSSAYRITFDNNYNMEYVQARQKPLKELEKYFK